MWAAASLLALQACAETGELAPQLRFEGESRLTAAQAPSEIANVIVALSGPEARLVEADYAARRLRIGHLPPGRYSLAVSALDGQATLVYFGAASAEVVADSIAQVEVLLAAP